MTDHKLKNTLGIGIFFGQLSLLLLVVLSPFYGVDLPDSMSLLTVIAPIFGAYAIIVVRYFVLHRYNIRVKGRPVAVPFAIVSVAAPAVLYLLTFTVFLAYALGWWNISLENTRLALTSTEALVGVYFGLTVEALFGARHVSSKD